VNIMSFKKIVLLGNVGKDPEIKTLQSGAQVANFGLAVSEKYKDRNGEQQEKTTWFDIAAFQTGERGIVTNVIKPYVKKGSMLFIEGSPEIETYEKDGQTRRAFKVRIGHQGTTLQLCGGKSGNGGDAKPGGRPEKTPIDDLSDEVPF
jgi:single-strand DNA-binding protein